MFIGNISNFTNYLASILLICISLIYFCWIAYVVLRAIISDPWDFIGEIMKIVAGVLIIVVIVFAHSSVTRFFDGLFDDSPTVYITQTGEKYHKRSCRYLNQSCTPIPLNKAKRNGYDPCSVCY